MRLYDSVPSTWPVGLPGVRARADCTDGRLLLQRLHDGGRAHVVRPGPEVHGAAGRHDVGHAVGHLPHERLHRGRQVEPAGVGREAVVRRDKEVGGRQPALVAQPVLDAADLAVHGGECRARLGRVESAGMGRRIGVAVPDEHDVGLDLW